MRHVKQMQRRSFLVRAGVVTLSATVGSGLVEAASARAGLEDGHPKAMAFLERIHARPAYQRALQKGGPYTIGR